MKSDTPVYRFKDRYMFLLVSIGFWALVSALASTRVGAMHNSSTVAFEFWVSILAGPFAFVEQKIYLQSPIGFIAFALILVAMMLLSTTFPNLLTKLLTVLGVSIWFIAGLVISFVGV